MNIFSSKTKRNYEIKGCVTQYLLKNECPHQKKLLKRGFEKVIKKLISPTKVFTAKRKTSLALQSFSEV